MKKHRLEAFSDGVLAIIITIMVLEMKVPHGTELSDLKPILPIFTSYILSFIYLGIYWNNHHHLWQAVESLNGKILWANLHLLFWLSLLPFVTGWMGENSFSELPVALYGLVLFMASVAWMILTHFILKSEGENSKLAKVLNKDYKQITSVLTYAAAVVIAFFIPIISIVIYAALAAIWFVPDKRIEKILTEGK